MTTPIDVIAEARTLENEFKAGRISASELKEMLDDLKRTKAVLAAANDLAVRGEIHQLIDGIITAAGAV